MKKAAAITLALLVFALALPGCTRQNTPAQTDTLSVIATIFAPFDFARAIAGDHADVSMLVPPASESHSFEPTPQDIIKIQNCDVFIYVGGESDAWVGQVLASMDTSNMRIITLMDCVETLEEAVSPSMEGGHEHEHDEHDDHDHDHEHDEHDDAHARDEHVWTSPRNAKRIVQKISDALCAADAANADAYKAGTADYLGKLDALDAAFEAALDGAARKTIVLGDRFPFRYLADAYGLGYDAAFPGCATETEASAATIAGLIDTINAEGIPAVFHIELSNMKMANTLAEATGAKVMLLHACHNISKDDFERGVTYLDLMHQNAENLKEALR